MSKVNRGKQFEEQVYKAFKKLQDKNLLSIDRIQDQMSGFKGSKNMCDFRVYAMPQCIYLECKCCYGNTLPLSNITDYQLDSLSLKAEILGVDAGVMIWFIDHDVTLYVPIQTVNALENQGKKSIRYNLKELLSDDAYFKEVPEIDKQWLCPERICEIEGVKRRVLFDYNINSFLFYIKADAVRACKFDCIAL